MKLNVKLTCSDKSLMNIIIIIIISVDIILYSKIKIYIYCDNEK